ncbi:MAG: RIP metalloprotease RseP [Candidatus Accumulibacter sp.]|jgi:regulator of sigma E protease|nr:RIP metalloprotease RseP [Accumulibacter sp.]
MSDFLFYALAFAVLLGVLIVVHELGHFVVARWAGVKVLRFSVGFGRPLVLWRAGKDATEWAIGIFPLGGYVRMLGEGDDGGDVAPHEAHRSFDRQSVWKRMAIVAAGPLANLAMATVLYWGLFMHGTEELRPVLGPPVAASPADLAGIRNGERVLRAGGEAVETWADLRWILLRRMMEQDSVELDLVDERGETSVCRLALAEARNPGPGEDPIERLGLRIFQPAIPAVLGSIAPGSAAAAAGLLPGDEVVSIDGQAVVSWTDVVRAVRAAPGRPLLFGYERGGAAFTVEITPAPVESGGREIGRIGAMVADPGFDRDGLLVTVRHGFLPALGKAIAETWDKSLFTLRSMGKMITGALSWHNISGPVTIADYAGQSARLGLDHYLRFMALVSLSLAVLNLLPVPVLDGGHLLYYVVEIARGRPLPDRCLMIGQKIGLALILMLMVFALYNDFTRLIPG